MDKKRKVTLVAGLLGALCLIGLMLFFSRYMILGGHILERSATQVVLAGEELPDIGRLQKLEDLKNLDVRSIPITPEEYEQLQGALPECKIYWMVPFQNGYSENTASEVAVQSLDADQKALLKYFVNLKTVNAQNCEDYGSLMQLQQERPDLAVIYTVDLGDCELRENVTECVATDANAKKLLENVQYLPALARIDGMGCRDYESLIRLRNARAGLEVDYEVVLGTASYSDDATQITLENADGQEALELLQYLPELTEVIFTGETPDNETMYQLKCRYPDVVMNWEFELFGVRTGSTATELILNEIPMESVETVESALKYFYDLQWVEMCQCGIPSEEMDALWKRHPETRFVWAIPMGSDYVRTDSKGFIPFKYGYTITNPFHDEEAKELKYLVDLEALDLGHMRMTDISFLQYMPKLRFLVLSDVICEDYSYLADLTELVFLEMFRSQIRDLGLLMNLKKLEDLNISWTTKLENPELLKEMTWLKRLWATANGMSRAQFKELQEALPNTTICSSAEHPTANGWRTSDRYFEMRDVLGMYYME